MAWQTLSVCSPVMTKHVTFDANLGHVFLSCDHAQIKTTVAFAVRRVTFHVHSPNGQTFCQGNNYSSSLYLELKPAAFFVL